MELQNITRDLRRTTLPVLPPALGFDGDVGIHDTSGHLEAVDSMGKG